MNDFTDAERAAPVRQHALLRKEKRLRFVTWFALAWIVAVVNIPDFVMGVLQYRNSLIHVVCDISGLAILAIALLYLLFTIKEERRVTWFLLIGMFLVLMSQAIRIARILNLLNGLQGIGSYDWYLLVRTFDEACNGVGLVLIAASFLTAIVDLFAAKGKLTVHREELSREIERRKEIEKEILQEKQKYKDLMHNLPVAVYRNTPGPEGRFLEMNPAHVAMLDADSEEEVMRYNVSDLYRTAAKRKEIADKLMRQGFIRNEEVELVTLRGRPIWGSVSAVVKHDREGKPYFDGIIEDITSRVEAERLLSEQRVRMIENARLASLGVMAGGIAHEINNPLAVIAGCAERLETCPDDMPMNDGSVKKFLRMIRDNTFRIQKIIQSLRTLSREASSDPFVASPLATIIDTAMELCRERFRLNNVHCEVTLPETPLSFECRPTQIGQVLINLFNNAFDAVRESPEKWMRLFASDQGDYVEITVEDSGAGFSDEAADKLFVPFFTTTPDQNGIGLGLSVSHAIVEAHHGEIRADTSSGHTRFTVRLPKSQRATTQQANS